MTKEIIETLIDGGNANPGPPLGPALGPLGVNTAEVVKAINEKTKGFSGMNIPVKVIVNVETKEFDIEIGSPPTSALIKKEVGAEKGSQDGKSVGNLSFQQLMRIADMKKSSILANDIKAAIKEVVGTCQSVNVTIEDRIPKEIIAEIDKGLLDDVIAGKTTQMPEIVIKEEEVKIVGEEKPEEKEEVEEEKEETKESEEEKAKEKEGERGKKADVKEEKGKDKKKSEKSK